MAIYRNGSSVWVPAVADASGSYGSAYGNSTRLFVPLTYLDSPATTSSTTYTVYMAIRSATGTFNPTDSTAGGSSITLLEISGA